MYSLPCCDVLQINDGPQPRIPVIPETPPQSSHSIHFTVRFNQIQSQRTAVRSVFMIKKRYLENQNQEKKKKNGYSVCGMSSDSIFFFSIIPQRKRMIRHYCERLTCIVITIKSSIDTWKLFAYVFFEWRAHPHSKYIYVRLVNGRLKSRETVFGGVSRYLQWIYGIKGVVYNLKKNKWFVFFRGLSS